MKHDHADNILKQAVPVDFDPFQGPELLFVIPSTEAQLELWASVQMGDEANCAFNESVSLRFRGDLDQHALQSAFRELALRHDALRSLFSPDGMFICIVKEMDLDFQMVDFSTLPAEKADEEKTRVIRQEMTQPFKLESGPLFRVRLLKMKAREHLLVFTAHHIVCDGWSMAVLMKELGGAYSAAVSGEPAGDPQKSLKPVYQYSQYAKAQNRYLQSAEYQAVVNFWYYQFTNEIRPLNFPTAKERPRFRTFNSAQEDWDIEAALVDGLKRAGMKAGCSLFVTLFSAFNVFLYRLCGNQEIVVGVPAAGQSYIGEPRLVGHCVSLLPIKNRIDGKSTFIDFLKASRKVVLDAFDNQQFTFGSLINKLALRRRAGGVPLVTVTFNLETQVESKDLQFSGLAVEKKSNPRMFENFEVFFNLVLTESRIKIECQYNTDLFDREMIRLRLSEFETVLKGILNHREQVIDDLPVLPDHEWQQQIKWNRTQADYPQDTCLHGLFEKQAARTPDSIAVAFQEQEITYRALNELADQVAGQLIDLGVGPEAGVGVLLDRSIHMVAALLAILKAGGAYVPLDPDFPRERTDLMMADCRINTVVTEEKYQSRFQSSGQALVVMDRAGRGVQNRPSKSGAPGVTIDNLACIFYTSDTEDSPKGVAVEHRSAVALISWAQKVYTPKEVAGVLASTPIAFDWAIMELFLPLSMGGTVILAEKALALPAPVSSHDLTLVSTVPSTMAELLKLNALPPSVKTVNLYGEPLSRALVDQLYSIDTVRRVYNLYGAFEATAVSACSLRVPGGRQTIGRPIANTEIYILDQALRPLPIGSAGEIFIGGIGLAREYVGRSELTRATFIPHPFKSGQGPRLFKSGDWARFYPDGTLELLGRADRFNTGGEEMPHETLPLPENKRSALDQAFVAPKNEMELVVSKTWCDILKLDKVGTHDNFFDVGGTSLLGIQVVLQLQRQLKRDIPVTKLFEFPTVESMAAFLAGGEDNTTLKDKIAARAQRKLTSLSRRRRVQKNDRII